MSYFSWVGMPFFMKFSSTQSIEFCISSMGFMWLRLTRPFLVSIAFFISLVMGFVWASRLVYLLWGVEVESGFVFLVVSFSLHVNASWSSCRVYVASRSTRCLFSVLRASLMYG
jgi:hypothetical protein